MSAAAGNEGALPAGEWGRAATSRPPRVSRSDLAFGLGLFVVAFVLRLVAALALSAEAVWDGQYYDFGARQIAAGVGYGDSRVDAGRAVFHAWCHYPVGYSAFLGAFYKLFGFSHGVAAVANALVGALLAVVTFLLAREALSPFRARFAGALVALHPGLVLYGALVMTEPLSALLTLAAFWTAIAVGRSSWLAERPRLGALRPFRGAMAGALVLGVAALVRPQALLCAPLLGLTVGAAGLPARLPRARLVGPLLGAALACACALLPVLPWTARNCRVMDGCALVSTNAGWNLAIGAFPRATGRFETLRSSDGCREVTGQVQQDRCWFDYGVSFIVHDTRRWLGLVPAKLGFTFDHESFAVEYLHEARPAAWPEARRAGGRELLTFVHRLLVAVSAFGFVGLAHHAPRARGRAIAVQGALTITLFALAVMGFVGWGAGAVKAFWPIVVIASIVPWLPLPGRPRSRADAALLLPVALLLTTVLAHAVFFGEDRYHMVVTPVFCLLAAAAFRRPGHEISDERAAESANVGAA